MENHEWIAPTRFEYRDAVAGLRSIEEDVPSVDGLGQTTNTSSTRFRQAHESIASASRQRGHLQSTLRESGPVAGNLFAGSEINGLSKLRTSTFESGYTLESPKEGPSSTIPSSVNERIGQANAGQSDPNRDRRSASPVSMDVRNALTGKPNFNHLGAADSRPDGLPWAPSMDVSSDRIHGKPENPDNGPAPSSDPVIRAGRVVQIDPQDTSLLGSQAALTQIHVGTASVIATEAADSGMTRVERSVPMDQRALADSQAETSDRLIRDSRPKSHPDRAFILTNAQASRAAGGMGFPQAPITGLVPPGIAPYTITRSATSPSSLAPSADGQWTGPLRNTDFSPIGGRGSVSELGAANGTIEHLLREQNELIRQDLQRNSSRPIAAPPPFRNSGIRM